MTSQRFVISFDLCNGSTAVGRTKSISGGSRSCHPCTYLTGDTFPTSDSYPKSSNSKLNGSDGIDDDDNLQVGCSLCLL